MVMDDRTQEMIRMRLDGKSPAKIAKHFGISRQRVDQILAPYPIRRKYVLNGAEKRQGATRGRVKAILDKIVLKVKKSV